MAKTEVKFKRVNIKQIKPYENNPRENSGAVGYVAESIREFGFRRPIVVDEDMVILAGHTRLMALERLGAEEATVAVVSGHVRPYAERAKAERLAAKEPSVTLPDNAA